MKIKWKKLKTGFKEFLKRCYSSFLNAIFKLKTILEKFFKWSFWSFLTAILTILILRLTCLSVDYSKQIFNETKEFNRQMLIQGHKDKAEFYIDKIKDYPERSMYYDELFKELKELFNMDTTYHLGYYYFLDCGEVKVRDKDTTMAFKCFDYAKQLTNDTTKIVERIKELKGE